jgi:hypothetical protein
MESYRDYNFYGCAWSLNNLWEFYYTFKQSMERNQQVNLPQEQSGIDISHVKHEKGLDKSQEAIESEINDLINVYPKEGFPNLKTLFGLSGQVENDVDFQVALDRAFHLISLITSYGTDLNAINEEVIYEKVLLKNIMLGEEIIGSNRIYTMQLKI